MKNLILACIATVVLSFSNATDLTDFTEVNEI